MLPAIVAAVVVAASTGAGAEWIAAIGTAVSAFIAILFAWPRLQEWLQTGKKRQERRDRAMYGTPADPESGLPAIPGMVHEHQALWRHHPNLHSEVQREAQTDGDTTG